MRVCATKVAVRTAKKKKQEKEKPLPGWKNCIGINTENLCFQKYNFSYFFLTDKRASERERRMLCLWYALLCTFSGYKQQLKFLVHYSFPLTEGAAKNKTQNWSERREEEKSWKITQCTRSDILVFLWRKSRRRESLCIQFMLRKKDSKQIIWLQGFHIRMQTWFFLLLIRLFISFRDRGT